MAVVRNLMIRAGADFSAFQKSMKKASKATQSFRNSTKATFKRIGTASLIMGTAIAYGAKKAIDAYDAQVVSETKLSTVMKQRMGATDDMVKSVTDLTKAQQQLGIIDDDAQNEGAQMLGTFLKQTDSLKKLIPAMNDLAAQQYGVNATSQDLATIGKMMGKVFTGQTGALKKAGISFTATQEKVLKFGNESEKSAMLAQVITDNVGAMNSALANTSIGRVAKLKNSFGDLQENIGQAISPLRDAMVPMLQSVVTNLGGLVTKLKGTMVYFATFLNALFGNKEADKIAGVTSGVNDNAEAYDGLADSAKDAKKQLAGFDEVTTLGKDSADGIGNTIDQINSISKTDLGIGITENFDDIKKRAKAMAEEFRTNTLPQLIALKDAFLKLWNAVVVDKLLPLLGAVGKWVLENPETFVKISGGLLAIAGAMKVINTVSSAIATIKGLQAAFKGFAVMTPVLTFTNAIAKAFMFLKSALQLTALELGGVVALSIAVLQDMFGEGLPLLKDWLKKMAQPIVDFINLIKTAVDALDKLYKSGKGPTMSGKDGGGYLGGPVSMPISMNATGGVTNGASIGMVGEAGREAILPLENNTGWMDMLAERLNGNSAPQTIILEIGGVEFTRAVVGANTRQTLRTGGLA